MSKVIIIDSSGNQREVSIEDFLKRLSPDNHTQRIADAKKVIALCLASADVPDDLKYVLRSHTFISDLPKGQQKKAVENTGTAMFPNFTSPYVVVGSAGSVWIDCVVRGRNCRVSLFPEATEAKHAISVNWM